jgi:hypothetical protein
MPKDASWNAIIENDKKLREEFRLQNHACPSCGEPGLLPLGGQGAYWIEHSCGAYSPIASSYAEALARPWVQVDSDINARMVPLIGG